MFKGRYAVFFKLCFSKILISKKLFDLLNLSNLQAMPRALSQPRCQWRGHPWTCGFCTGRNRWRYPSQRPRKTWVCTGRGKPHFKLSVLCLLCVEKKWDIQQRTKPVLGDQTVREAQRGVISYHSPPSERLEPYTRVNSPNPPCPKVAVFQKRLRSLTQSSQNKTLYHNP